MVAGDDLPRDAERQVNSVRRRERFSSADRLRDPRDFERVYAAQAVVRAPNLVVFSCPNGLAISRLGVSVGCKHGNAVRRNRIKRVLRAAFRACRALLPPGRDYVLIPRQGVKEYRCADVCQSLRNMVKRIGADK